jgi:hypothetical protein
MKKILVFSLFIGLAGAVSGQQAQTAPPAQSASAAQRQPMDMAKFHMAITEERRKLFAAGMGNLTPAQLEAFWAVYATFEKEKDAITAARLELFRKYIETYSALTDAEISAMVTDSADTQKKNTDLRVKYFGIYSQKINAKAAGRFVLIDDYITTAFRLSLLNQLPLPVEGAAR